MYRLIIVATALLLASTCMADNVDTVRELLLEARARLRNRSTTTAVASEEDSSEVTSTSCSHGLDSDDIALFRSRENVTVRVGVSTIHIYSNGWPDHAYGPSPSKDNPNSITTQSNHFPVPLCPVEDDSGPSCLPPGPIGVAVNGIPIFNPFNSNGEDAVANEVMDSCDGHPDVSGTYHYHGHPGCIDDGSEETLIGVAYDGYPIYGPFNDDGSVVTSADLDECHGESLEDGTYRYRVTFDYPYILGCFKGDVPSKVANKQSGTDCYFAKRDGIYQRSLSSQHAAGQLAVAKGRQNEDFKRLLQVLNRLLEDN